MLTAAELRRLYEAGDITETELERQLERLAEREGVDALTLSDPDEPSAGPDPVEHGMTRWFALATLLVAVAIAVQSITPLRTVAVGGAALSVAAGVCSLATYSYRRGSLPRAAEP